MAPPDPLRRDPRALAAFACAPLTVALATVSLLRPDLAGLASDIVSPVVAGIACLLALLTAWQAKGRLRQAWAFIGAGIGANVAGDLVWAWYEITLPEPPFPSIADVFYVALYPLCLLGLLRIPVAPFAPGERLRAGLDLAVVFTGAGMVVWHGIVGPTSAQYGADWLAQAAAAGPPVGSLVLLVGVGMLLLRRPAASVRRTLQLLLAAFLLQIAGDLWYAWSAISGAYDSGDPVDVVWVAGFALLAFAAVRQGADVDVEEDGSWTPRRVGSALPYLGIALGFGLLARVAWEADGAAGTYGTLVGAAVLCVLVIARQVVAMREIEALTTALTAQNDALRQEQERSERLLLNILPVSVATRLKTGVQGIIADTHPEATVLFADLVGFTALSARTPPQDLIAILNDVFSRFDRLAERHGLEKIKTIGDAYMAASGVPVPMEGHARAAAEMALAMVEEVAAANAERGLSLQIRIGLNTGPLVAGVIGERKFIYDLWGDTVNVASRMESHGKPGCVQLTESVRRQLGDEYELAPRGTLEVKGRGTMEAWLLVGRRQQAAVPAK